MHQKYNHLCSLSKQTTLLHGISSLLGWDQETYMPEKAGAVRAEQQEVLAKLAHTMATDHEFEKRLSALIDITSGKIKDKTLNSAQKASVHLFRRDFIREKKLPTSFVQEMSKVTSESVCIWQKAKEQSNFSLFKPALERIVTLIRKKTDLLGYDAHPYDALLDEYEPEATVAQIDTIFAEIKNTSKQIIKKWDGKKHTSLDLNASATKQLQLSKWLLEYIGFDFTRGRVDVSSHPFSSSCHPNDSRLTTRTESTGIAGQVFTTLHEAGHSFYEMGLPIEHFGTPLCQAASFGIHESQSRFWETRIGRSTALWSAIFPKLKKIFPKQLAKETAQSLSKKLNQVKPSLIRVDADEVTYPLHIILRYEIEKELITGKLLVAELPERWNSGMKTLLGITPTNDAVGVLQDIHWSIGAFGYFPSYCLGNIYASALFDAFEKEHNNWQQSISRGDFSDIHSWLSKHIWQHGRRFSPRELIEKATGKPLSAKPLARYLKEKY